MPKTLIAILLAFFLLQSGWTQEDDDSSDKSSDAQTDGQVEAPDAATAEVEEEVDDADLDEQTYEEDEDDFIPTEEIPADEPIPFPSNI